MRNWRQIMEALAEQRKRWRWTIGLIALLIAASAGTAAADPIRITQGSIQVGADGTLVYDFGGPLLSIQSLAPVSWAGLGLTLPCSAAPCAAGTSVNLSNSTSGIVSLGFGHVSDAVLDYGDNELLVDWQFTAPDSPLLEGGSRLNVQVPFTLSGSLLAMNGGRPITSYAFTGSGTASEILNQEGGGYRAADGTALAYSFSGTQTPEPSSLLLLGMGAAFVARRINARKR